MKVWCEIGGTTGCRGDVNIMNVNEDIVDGGSNGSAQSWSRRGIVSRKGCG